MTQPAGEGNQTLVTAIVVLSGVKWTACITQSGFIEADAETQFATTKTAVNWERGEVEGIKK
jgi:hypothetical protein